MPHREWQTNLFGGAVLAMFSDPTKFLFPLKKKYHYHWTGDGCVQGVQCTTTVDISVRAMAGRGCPRIWYLLCQPPSPPPFGIVPPHDNLNMTRRCPTATPWLYSDDRRNKNAEKWKFLLPLMDGYALYIVQSSFRGLPWCLWLTVV